ncbi:hypothetical protein [Pseudomonas qingdaonensis]|uniref:hypothetical protein n=1 Tax=Pseudomonas qingdaonensis TaxID=2056231 RepID=UPI0028A859A9|nr:hypothetical protein [Pseudomonas qingdaonensis]
MSKNPDIHVFTSEQLKARDRQIATRIHQATVASTIRAANKMNPGQILRASRSRGRDLLWSDEALDKVLEHVFQN